MRQEIRITTEMTQSQKWVRASEAMEEMREAIVSALMTDKRLTPSERQRLHAFVRCDEALKLIARET